MTSVWVAEHGWCYLNAAIDCCTRKITGCRWTFAAAPQQATVVIDQAVTHRGVPAGTLTLGTDNATAFTSRAFRARLAAAAVRDCRARLTTAA